MKNIKMKNKQLNIENEKEMIIVVDSDFSQCHLFLMTHDRMFYLSAVI